MKRNVFMAMVRRIRNNGETTISSKSVSDCMLEFIIQALKGHVVFEDDGEFTTFIYA
jgi:hypothetical protein